MNHRVSLLAAVLCCTVAHAESRHVTVVLTRTTSAQKYVVVSFPVDKSDAEKFRSFKSAYVTAGPFGAASSPAQLINGKEPRVVFVLPDFPADNEVRVTLTLDTAASLPSSTGGPTQTFAWKDADGDQPILEFDGKPVLKYVRPKFDPALTTPTQKAIANPTIKVFHHLMDQTGKVQLTNGAEGQFPHHRGIFFGFNNISYAGKKADIWHCGKGESQQHVGIVEHRAGPVFGGQTVRVSWNGQDGKLFATEVRSLNVFHEAKGHLIEFSSTLTTELEMVRLDGDPQHAGFHFRANVEVEKTKDQTYFMSPAGKGEVGKEVNWEPKGKHGPTNRPWTVMSFVVAGKRYSVLYLDYPSNPKEARQSERTYGRVGTYFEYDLTKDKPLRIKYRLWVQEGEITAAECEQMSKAFVEPPTVVP